MKFTVTIDMDNAAFEPSAGDELERIMASVLARVDDGITVGRCMDSNGNMVGSFEVIA